ncbi:MAG: tetratricopeptide repeat protein [Planctomycetaceae bacterium]|nr:tetratricopeptide repeat protein [Planctomycetaceae bacterium]
MKRPFRDFRFLLLLAGLNLAMGCGLTPKSVPAPTAPSHGGVQPTKPLKQLSPELAAEACLSTARQLEEKGRLRDAITQYERARTHQPQRPGIAHRLAVLHDRLGNTPDARKEYQAAVDETPNNADLLNDLGYFHFQRQQFPEAEQRYREAVQLKPDHSRAWTNLGLTLGAQKRFQEAEAAFQKAGSPAFAQHNLGIVCAQQGEYEKARAAFREAQRLDPMLKQPEAVLAWLNDQPQPAGSARVNAH